MLLKVYAESLCESFRLLLSEQEVTISEWEFIQKNLTDFIQCDNETYLKAVTSIAKEFNLRLKLTDKDSDSSIDYNLIGGEYGLNPKAALALDAKGIYFQILCPIDLNGWRSSIIDE